MIAKGYSGEDLLDRFRLAQKQIRPAVERMLSDAEKAALSEIESASYNDVFGAEE
ncbi:hypothetical protein [Schaedlerella arabinosiphila]|uniref:hypothetical protein n=1 Tax=Schaedlerella arabinosiphila TaxID=2044587 RepID=UPI001FAA56F6|nr:hypothetical protein [Schaedlerella arabinosiphila]